MSRSILLALAALLTAGLAVSCASNPAPPPAAEGLIGTSWVCVSIEGEPMEAGADVTLQWKKGGKLVGNGGVNRLFAGWSSMGGAAVSFSEIGMTRRAGPLAHMKQETRFVSALEAVDQAYRLDGGLQLFGGGRMLLQFRPQVAIRARG